MSKTHLDNSWASSLECRAYTILPSFRRGLKRSSNVSAHAELKAAMSTSTSFSLSSQVSFSGLATALASFAGKTASRAAKRTLSAGRHGAATRVKTGRTSVPASTSEASHSSRNFPIAFLKLFSLKLFPKTHFPADSTASV